MLPLHRVVTEGYSVTAARSTQLLKPLCPTDRQLAMPAVSARFLTMLEKAQPLLEPVQRIGLILQLALPYNQDVPAGSAKGIDISEVSRHVLLKFFAPEFGPRLRGCRERATRMAVPEAAMYKNANS